MVYVALILKSFTYLMQQGATPLIMASQRGHNDVIELLLDRGANVDHPTKVPSSAAFLGIEC